MLRHHAAAPLQVRVSAARGFAFWVYPSAFIVHRPHTQSQARKSFLQSKMSGLPFDQLRGSVYERVESLWNKTLSAMAAGSYSVPVDEPVANCTRVLEWWRQ